MAKYLHDMTPDEQADALGTCDQGRKLLRRHNGIVPLFEFLREGCYPDQVMVDLLRQFWAAIRRRAVALCDGHDNESDHINAPAISRAQFELATPGASGVPHDDPEWQDDAARRLRNYVYTQEGQIHEYVADSRLRLIPELLPTAIRFARAGTDDGAAATEAARAVSRVPPGAFLLTPPAGVEIASGVFAKGGNIALESVDVDDPPRAGRVARHWPEDGDADRFLPLDEFVRLGYLQEVNRQFFHPLGLALVLEQDEEGGLTFAGFEDRRDDLEGMLFAESWVGTEQARRRARYVVAEQSGRAKLRSRDLGFVVQPIGAASEVKPGSEEDELPELDWRFADDKAAAPTFAFSNREPTESERPSSPPRGYSDLVHAVAKEPEAAAGRAPCEVAVEVIDRLHNELALYGRGLDGLKAVVSSRPEGRAHGVSVPEAAIAIIRSLEEPLGNGRAEVLLNHLIKRLRSILELHPSKLTGAPYLADEINEVIARYARERDAAKFECEQLALACRQTAPGAVGVATLEKLWDDAKRYSRPFEDELFRETGRAGEEGES